MNDIKCPFCGQEMKRTNGIHNKVGVWQCQNSNDPDNVCIASGYLFNDDVLNYIARTRKALGIAVGAIKTIKYSKKSDAINLRHKANKALIDIYKIKDQTALEQKN